MDMTHGMLPCWPAMLSPDELKLAKTYPGLAVFEVFAEEWGPCTAIAPMMDDMINNVDETLPPILYFRAMCTPDEFSGALHDSSPSFAVYKNGALSNQVRGPGAALCPAVDNLPTLLQMFQRCSV